MASHQSTSNPLAPTTGSRRHGGFGTPTYKSWESMKSRCYNPHDRCYALYGGRGITVCDAWRHPNGFPQFLADLGPRPTRQHTLDRLDPHGNYEPGNVRWATPDEQAQNKRNTVFLSVDGRTQTLMQWARELGIKSETLRYRLAKGWSHEQALGPRPPRLRDNKGRFYKAQEPA